MLELLRWPLNELGAMDLHDLAHAPALGAAAGWLLRDEVLRAAADYHPGLAPVEKPLAANPEGLAGTCGVVYALDGPEQFPLLREAFLLTVRWQPGGADDPGLPEGLRGLADRVRGQVAPGRAYSLHRAYPYRACDLPALDALLKLKHDSGWAALAGGLIREELAAQGEGRPRPEVWATGCWDERGGISAVGGLPAKLALARRWGAAEVYVPECDDPGPAAGGLTVGKLLTGLRLPRDALRHYLLALETAPARDDSPAARREFYLRHYHTPRGKDFYQECILPDVIRDRQRQVRAGLGLSAPPHLVTVYSDHPELIPLAVGAFDASTCLVFHTATMATRAGGLARAMPREDSTSGERVVRVRPCPFPADEVLVPDNDETLRRLAGEVRAACPGVPPDRLVFDLTPGHKSMSLCLERMAQRYFPGSLLVYLQHRMEDRKAVPFTERYSWWRAGNPGEGLPPPPTSP